MAGWLETNWPWEPEPAEYWPGHGWYQTGEKIRLPEKKKYHWIWPNDGKRDGKWGRMKDILSGKGPDIHIAISADKMDYMKNRQPRSTWANYTKHHLGGPNVALPDARWARRGSDEVYDFRTRRYRRPYSRMWTDVRWPIPAERKGDLHRRPLAYRDVDGVWMQYDPDAWWKWLHQNGGIPPAFPAVPS